MRYNHLQQPTVFVRRLSDQPGYAYGLVENGVRVPRGIVGTFQEALVETEALKASLPKPEKATYTFEGAGL